MVTGAILGALCSPLISAALLATWRGGRALAHHIHTRRTR